MESRFWTDQWLDSSTQSEVYSSCDISDSKQTDNDEAKKINNMFLRHILENDAGWRLFIFYFLNEML